jgi:hypothetical protein
MTLEYTPQSVCHRNKNVQGACDVMCPQTIWSQFIQHFSFSVVCTNWSKIIPHFIFIVRGLPRVPEFCMFIAIIIKKQDNLFCRDQVARGACVVCMAQRCDFEGSAKKKVQTYLCTCFNFKFC